MSLSDMLLNRKPSTPASSSAGSKKPDINKIPVAQRGKYGTERDMRGLNQRPLKHIRLNGETMDKRKLAEVLVAIGKNKHHATTFKEFKERLRKASKYHMSMTWEDKRELTHYVEKIAQKELSKLPKKDLQAKTVDEPNARSARRVDAKAVVQDIRNRATPKNQTAGSEDSFSRLGITSVGAASRGALAPKVNKLEASGISSVSGLNAQGLTKTDNTGNLGSGASGPKMAPRPLNRSF